MTKNIDIKVLVSVLSVLKYNPKYESTELRNIVRYVVPSRTQINAQYLANLRRRAAIHHLKNPDMSQTDQSEAADLLSSGQLIEKE